MVPQTKRALLSLILAEPDLVVGIVAVASAVLSSPAMRRIHQQSIIALRVSLQSYVRDETDDLQGMWSDLVLDAQSARVGRLESLLYATFLLSLERRQAPRKREDAVRTDIDRQLYLRCSLLNKAAGQVGLCRLSLNGSDDLADRRTKCRSSAKTANQPD